MQKTYVIDHTVLTADPKAATEGFDDNSVVIPLYTVSILRRLAGSSADEAKSAQAAILELNMLFEIGDPLTKNGGWCEIAATGAIPQTKDREFSREAEISAACEIAKAKNGIYVTNDPAAKLMAVGLGIYCQHYKNSAITASGFTGHVSFTDMPSSFLDDLYKYKKVPHETGLYENEFIKISNGSKSALGVYRNKCVELIPEQRIFGGFRPKNALQSFAMWALTAPAEEIPLVILSGPAGTAKTFLSLAGGLDGTMHSQRSSENRYFNMLISRPNTEAGDPGFGYLPGSLMDKMQPLLLPYFDNLEALMAGAEGEERSQIKMRVDDLFESDTVEICALNYIRGRSLWNSYLICDEAQNASRSLIRDVITRAGAGTKIVLCGDPDQIDAPGLSRNNNGLVSAIEGMKESPLSAIVTFDAAQSVRSPLAKEAIGRM